MGLGQSKPVESNVSPIFEEIVQDSTTKTENVVNEIAQLIGNAGFKGAEDVPNPESSVDMNPETNQLEFYGGTFSVDSGLQETLVGSLEESLLSFTDNEEFIGGADKSTEVKVLRLLHDGISKLNNEYGNISNAINEKISTLHSLQVFLKKGLNKLSSLVDENKSEAKVITEVQEALLKEIDRQLILLQNLIKVNVKPTKESLMELLKKNKNFTNLAETLGTSYNTEEASDRLALVFTNISQLGLAAENVKEALKTLNMSLKEYSNVKDVKSLESKIASVMKSLKGKKVNELNDIMKAIKVLKNNQISHDRIVKCLENSKNCDVSKIGGQESDEPVFDNESEIVDGSLDTDSIDVFFDNESEMVDGSLDTETSDVFFDNEGEMVDGGEYTQEVGRLVKPRTKSALSKRINTYEQTMKELFKSFMNQVNSNFKELSSLVDLLSTKVGSEISYDDDLKKFIDMFSGLNENLDNEKIFYSLINLDSTLAGKEQKNRFHDNLDIIISSCNGLNNYKIFNDISKNLKNFKVIIDTYSDTVLNLQKSEGQKTGSNEEFVWTDNLLDTSFSINNIKLIKNSIKKLQFFSKVSNIKQNLLHMTSEHKANQEDYSKLLGKSIGVKLSELNKEYVENVDRLNDKTRGRGFLLEEHNRGKLQADNDYLPRGLIENIYKIQYEAKEGLYKTIEAIDLYLMNFTEILSANPEAIMDLNKMLEQTEIIAKWFNAKSVDNLVTLLDNQIKPENSDKYDDIDDIIQKSLNLSKFSFNTPILGKRVKEAYEQCKKAIDSISALKNIISMFVHIGEKFGNKNLSSSLLMSPNVIYKNLVKYIWVSAFSMGYGTTGGDVEKQAAGSLNKGLYELEKGDKESFFNILFTTIVLPLDIYKELETTVIKTLKTETLNNEAKTILANQVIKRLQNRDIFIIDDKYFILAIKAIVGKIFTVIDTHTLFKIPNKLSTIMKNPVRTILGANQSTEIIPEAVELYIRLPLLVEFYKHIFYDGNKTYKDQKTMSDIEIIAYIPEIGTIWSGLIQCIFDESRYIDLGIYNINNMKSIIYEVNNIYKYYAKKVSNDKLVKTVVLDLVSEVNRRYGILKEKDIAEFYQIKKKYQKHQGNVKFEENVNFDILDENNEYQLEGPSSMYVEKQFNKYSNDALVITDIKMVNDFRKKIYTELFGNSLIDVDQLSKKSFNEKIKFCKTQIKNAKNIDEQFELIISAIDQTSNVNAHNIDSYLLFNELVLYPISLLQSINKHIIESINLLTKQTNKLLLINDLYKLFNDENLFKVKMVSNTKFIIDYSNLQNMVELFLENIKYNISKFRNTICKDIVNQYESVLYNLEDNLLNYLIKNDSTIENYENYSKLYEYNLENLNNFLAKNITPDLQTKAILSNFDTVFKIIQFGTNDGINATEQRKKYGLLKDVFSKYDSSKKTWVPKDNIVYLNNIIPTTINDYSTFENKSILQKFNTLIFSYVNTFYNESTKKIYSKLFDEFANKTMSSTIYENGGIPDIYEGTFTEPLPMNNSSIKNNSVLSLTLSQVFRTLLTRNLNVQLPIKYHLLDNISDVSTVQIEKYKVYLPYYINYFDKLIKECIIYKKLLDNPNIQISDPAAPTIGPNEKYTEDKSLLTDDLNSIIKFKEYLVNGPIDYNGHKVNFHNLLNNIINGSRSLINDANVVLSEINYVSQFGNVYDNFIKNFYNNNNELPYMPISILYYIDTLQMSGPNNSALLPNGINTNESKYINYTNFILNNESNNKEQDINNYLWLKEQVKIYNNSALSTNTLDSKKLNQFLSNNKNLINYLYLAKHIHNNLYYNDTTNERVGFPQVGEMAFTGGYYFTLSKNNNLNTIINMIENSFNYNKKLLIVNEILQIKSKECSDKSLENYSMERNEARILNIIDLNIMPINIHALLREVPLINVYNYASTFDEVVTNLLGKQLSNADYYQDVNNYELLSLLLQDPYYINSYKTDPDRYKNLIEKYLSIPKDNNSDKPKDVYLSIPKYLINTFNKLSTNNLTNESKNSLIYNNKFLRNILFLVNIQRVIRLKIKSAVYNINNNVVSHSNLMNMRITEFVDKEKTDIDENEFEITDLIN